MKTLFFVLVVSVLYAACTGTTSDSKENSDSTANASTTLGTSSISYPYTASFSSKISRGKDSNALLVLNSYKAWENGDMTALANTFSDSMDITFSDGSEFKGTRDSAIAMAKKYRDSLSSVKIDMNVWMPVHADDKNGDAVLAWYTETDTYKNGKVDSMYFHDINGIKDGKIDFIESYGRKAKK